MAKTRALLLGVVLITIARPGYAQIAEPGWQVTLQLLQMAARGNDVHAGDVYTYTERTGGTATNLTDTYGTTYNPIMTTMGSRATWLAEVRYSRANWSIGATGWRMATDGASSGSTTSPAPTSTTSTIRGVRMWDNSIVPVSNNLEASGLSPIGYHARGMIESRRIDAYAERLGASGQGFTSAWRVGFAVARLENTRAEGQTQTARTVTTSGGITQTFSNNISLDGTSSSTLTLRGPAFSWVGNTSLRRIRLDWLAGPAVLIGTAQNSGSWIDIDSITIHQVGSGVDTTSTQLLHGDGPYLAKERAVVPVMDVQVKASVQVHKQLRVGLGVLSSSYFSLPAAPSFAVPGNWTILEGTGWKEQHHDVTFLGVSAFAAFRF